MTRVLLTGCAGFIGSNFVEYALKQHPDWHLTNLDKLTYAGFHENITPFQQQFPDRYRFVWGDVCNAWMVNDLVKQADLIIHFAAESNVDISILAGDDFLTTNIQGTKVILDAVRRYGADRVLVVSTDEVYGNAYQDRPSLEDDPLMPCSPYAASKAAQDVLAFSYYETYHLPIVRTRCSNNFGPRQDPTKLIPRFILHALYDQPLPIYGNGQNRRDWIYVRDHCEAIDQVLHADARFDGEVFNIGADCERNVLEISHLLLDQLGRGEHLMGFVDDRPGHVKRHAVNVQKIETQLGWKATTSFESALNQTVQWYQDNRDWVKAIVKTQSDRLPHYDKTYALRQWLS